MIPTTLHPFYCSSESPKETEDLKSVREALFTIIKHYVQRGISMDDLQSILMFIQTVENVKVVCLILEFVSAFNSYCVVCTINH